MEDTSLGQPAALGLKAQFTKSPSFNDFPSPYAQPVEIRFHLSATINADTGKSAHVLSRHLQLDLFMSYLLLSFRLPSGADDGR